MRVRVFVRVRVCMCVFQCMCIPEEAKRGHQISDLLELDLQMVVSHLTWELATQSLGPLEVQKVMTSDPHTISPASKVFLSKLKYVPSPRVYCPSNFALAPQSCFRV